MESEHIILAIISIIGGTAVLGSYVLGVRNHPDTRGQTWGGVPAGLKPFYIVSMLTAAAGYLAFAYFVFFEAEPDVVELFGSSSYWLFYLICAGILLPSAMWMPLTFSMLEQPSRAKWISIRIVLGIVGIVSLALLAALITLEPREPAAAYWASVVGIVFFCIQTAFLDALVWPIYFPIKR